MEPPQAEEEEGDKYQKMCSLYREQFAKYQGFIRKVDYEKNESLSVTLAFPLDLKKVLMVSIVENVLQKVLLRAIKGIERIILVANEEKKETEEAFIIVQGLNFSIFC